MAEAQKKPISGYARAKQKGLVVFNLTMTPAERDELQEAATKERRSISHYLLHHGLQHARRISKT